ncbi:MAG: hypothetical protein JWO11_547 [Nocardioides sp.]|nr:hypothetical protein [Nocardioides sp.]
MYMHLLTQAFSGQRWDIHDVIAEGDKVVIRCAHTGQQIGDFFGLPATGRHPLIHPACDFDVGRR